jgi:lipid II:glycine glycyltransferase (peptidoglycan interpeptide bridge formation enzyme)
MLDKLQEIGKKEKCIFIQLEPNIIGNQELGIMNQGNNSKLAKFETIIHDSQFMIQPSAHPLFTKYTFILDLTKTEEELLRKMHPKTRYNIKVAQKHGVLVVEDNSDDAFEAYIKLTHETTKRQGFYAHTENYHRIQWETLGAKNQESGIRNQEKDKKEKIHDSYFMIHNSDKLTAHILTAKYQDKTLVAWILFIYKDTLYYPYGASSNEHRETMASNLMMWEAIKFGKKLGLKKFDMWGSLGPNPDPKDPWYGFHRFKQGYGPELVEFIGSYDLIINPMLYQLYKIADKIRWFILKFMQ